AFGRGRGDRPLACAGPGCHTRHRGRTGRSRTGPPPSWPGTGRRERKGTAVPIISCSACGKQIPDAAPACPHCGQPAGRTGRRRGLPVWGKLLLFLLLGVSIVGFFAVAKPSEAELRQAIRAKGQELQARGMSGPPVLIDDPKYAGRFTYHAHFLS